MGDREFGEQVVEFGFAAVAVGFDDLEHGTNILLDREAPENRCLLRQIADAAARAAIHRKVGHVVPVEQDRAVVGGNKPGDHVEDGGLAGAIGAEEADRLAALDVETDAADDGTPLEALADFLDPEPRIVGNEMRSAPAFSRCGLASSDCPRFARHQAPITLLMP